MTYLTRIIADKATILNERLTDGYAWHQALWKCFPNRDNEARDFLTRVDQIQDDYQVYLLSCTEPTPSDWGQWSTKTIKDSFLSHPQYRFALRANPTTKRVVRDQHGERKKNGQRIAIYDPEALTNWLHRKGKDSGFTILHSEVSPPIARYFRRKGTTGKHISVDYQGILQVDSPTDFERTFSTGIGSAKGFGFGMLMLQPSH